MSRVETLLETKWLPTFIKKKRLFLPEGVTSEYREAQFGQY